MNKSVVAVFMIVTSLLRAQSPADSLEQKLQTNLPAAERIGILSELCWQYRLVDQQKAFAYGKQAVALARKTNDQNGLSKSLNDLAIVYMDKTLLDSAIMLLNEALTIRVALKDSVGQAAIYNKLGIIYQNRLDLGKALENALNALKIYEALKMTPHQMIILNNIGIIHYNLRNFSKSLEIHTQLLKLREQSDDQAGMGQTLLNLGNVHIALGDTVLGMNDHKKAADIFRELGRRDELATALNNIGAFQNLRKEYAGARKNLEESLTIRRALNKQKDICSTLILLGEVNTLTGNLKVAEKNLREAMAISRHLELPVERLCYQKMARLYTRLNKADSVFAYYEKYEILNTRLYEDNLKNEVAGLQTKYETEKKEQEIASLKQKNTIQELAGSRQRTYYAGALLIAGVAGISLFRFQKNKRFKEKTRLQLELQKQQEQAARDVIDAEMNERRRIAGELHDGVGQIFSAARMNLSG
ncbi:MAG TPA: tetratricopeptide repeat protein, partial [Cyclobacteriaceae bacterium]|nr:tetratricopeptide repeat protein [Cyclobacteriaceae bacterium]